VARSVRTFDPLAAATVLFGIVAAIFLVTAI
jgi:hypothetical protein